VALAEGESRWIPDSAARFRDDGRGAVFAVTADGAVFGMTAKGAG
jgi:hypothetical protein